MLIKFNTQMIQVLNEALALVPYGRAAPVIAEINRQVNDIETSRKASEEKQRQEEIERAIAESKKLENSSIKKKGGKCAAE